MEDFVELKISTSATADRRVTVDVPFPRIMDENVEVVKMFPRSACQNVFSQLDGEPVPQEIVERVRWTSATADRRVSADVLFHRSWKIMSR